MVDLSTGINPHGWPVPAIPADAFARLPDPADHAALLAVAADAYGAPSPAHLTAAPGTQILLPLVMGLAAPGRAAILSPTYAEHARAARIVGHAVEEVGEAEALAGADVAVVVNPNNPDGRLLTRANLLEIASRVGLLVVDEAFMDVGPEGHSVAPDAAGGGIVVLRSFGKFFGLAGLRLGFAVADASTTALLSERLGPWAVSGPAISVAGAALADRPWRAAMRDRLAKEADRLDAVLAEAGLGVAGGTPLFRLVRAPDAEAVFERLGRAGIMVRRFAERPDVLRFGLPADAAARSRLAAALRR